MRWRTLKTKKYHKIQPSGAKIFYAPFWPRLAGFATDIFMIGLPITLITMMLFGYDQMHTATAMDVIVHSDKARLNPPNPIASIMQITLFLITFVWLWHRDGQTPGKKLARIRVVDAATLKNAPYWKLILRFFLYPIGAITFISLFRKDKRSLHDLLSGTAVIRVP
jgi:uncharacterized RDD family membrane protein YckC